MAAHDPGGAMRKVILLTIATASILSIFSSSSLAHEGEHESFPLFENIEISQILTLLGLIALLTIYVIGLRNLWKAAGRDHGISEKSVAAFTFGWLSLFIALIGPFHDLSEKLFSAHMTQHEILMLISAPLVALGRPQIAAVWAFRQDRRKSVAAIVNDPTFKTYWRFISNGFVAFLIHAIALWIWHIPVLFDATLKSDTIHALQHASFFGTALLFWWAIINSRLDWKSSFVGVLYLFITSLHSGILGAFLTFTHRLWYSAYADSTAPWGITALEDQQLGGLIMWVPAGLVYIGAGLLMFGRLLRQSEKRALEFDQKILAESVSSNI
jgi:putative membrane protein